MIREVTRNHEKKVRGEGKGGEGVGGRAGGRKEKGKRGKRNLRFKQILNSYRSSGTTWWTFECHSIGVIQTIIDKQTRSSVKANLNILMLVKIGTHG